MASYQMVGFEVRQGGFDLTANYLKEMGYRVKTCIPAGMSRRDAGSSSSR